MASKKSTSKAQLRSQIRNQYEIAKIEMERLSALIRLFGELVVQDDPCYDGDPSLAAVVALKPLDWGDGGTEFGVVLEAIARAVGPLDWGDPGTEFSVVLGAVLEALKPMDWGDGGTEFIAVLSTILTAQKAARSARKKKSRKK
jgi:hypothetical protein